MTQFHKRLLWRKRSLKLCLLVHNYIKPVYKQTACSLQMCKRTLHRPNTLAGHAPSSTLCCDDEGGDDRSSLGSRSLHLELNFNRYYPSARRHLHTCQSFGRLRVTQSHTHTHPHNVTRFMAHQLPAINWAQALSWLESQVPYVSTLESRCRKKFVLNSSVLYA